MSTPGTWTYKKCSFWPKANHNSSAPQQQQWARIIESSTEWMMTFTKNDVSGRSIVPNHWKHWMTALQHEDVTCVSHSDGDHISTTKYHNDNMKCPTTLTTILYQVPRNYCKEDQILIPGINKEKILGKKIKKWKIKQKEKWPKSGTPGSPMAKTGYPLPR